MLRRTLLRGLSICLVCAALAVAAPLFAASPTTDVSVDDPVVEPQNGPFVDPNG